MTNFGWSLPAGCGKLPGEEDPGPCPICQGDVDTGKCNCPECKICGVSGDPSCINIHMPWSKWPTLVGLSPMKIHLMEQERISEELRSTFDD